MEPVAGSGTAAVQIARAMGMVVLARRVRKGSNWSDGKARTTFLTILKADYLEQIMKVTGGKGVDVILEMLANVNLGQDLKLLA